MNKLLSRISPALLSAGVLVMFGFAGPDDPLTKAGQSAGKKVSARARVIEGYPARTHARLVARDQALRNLPSHSGGMAPRFIINISKRWKTGQTVTVAFKGADDALAKSIADTVNQWTTFANLNFDFGTTGSTGFRTWDPSDTTFKANIRVSFDQPGFYSLIGNDSINRVVTRTGEESLNLQGFADNLPSDWQGVALHEFGHAIGFEHEHQSPGAPCDFRFADEIGYVPTTDSFGQFVADSAGRNPGLYTTLGGPPNNWTKEVVDFNLQALPASHAFEVGPFDKDSIMKYFFDSPMFISGTASKCYTGAENLILSAGDKTGAAKVYPRSPADIRAVSDLRKNILTDASKAVALSEAGRDQFRQALNLIQDR